MRRCATISWASCDISATTRCGAGDMFTPPAELIDRWVAANQRSVERIERIFSDIGNGGVFDLTTLSVALRQLRNVVLASGPSV